VKAYKPKRVVSIIPVLFVDDNRELSNIFQFYLEETGLFTVHVCLDGLDALEYLERHDIQAVISDFDMPDMDGITLLRHIREKYPYLPFIMLTGNDSKETAIEALNAGADFYQNKAEDLEIQVLDLSHKITILVEKARAEAAIQRKDLILEVIGRAAGRLLKGEHFYAEMKTILEELGQVTGAAGAFIGDPRHHDERSDVPEFITWWKDKGKALANPNQDDLFADLIRAMEMSHDDDPCIIINPDDASPSEREALTRLEVDSAVFLPVKAGDERWGYLTLFFTGKKKDLATPELYAYTLLTELAGAARYRAYMEDYFKNPVEKSLVGVFLIRNNRFLYINPRFSAIFGYSQAEIIRTKSLPGLFQMPDAEIVRETLDQIMSGWREHAHLEVTALNRDGVQIQIELYVTMFRCNGAHCLIGNCLDITQRKEAEEKVRAQEELLKQNMMTSLKEKETLLREIHHRVKNNMQIIASLLRLTDFQSGNPEVHEVIRDCRNRIFSMASIHEKLYQTEDLANVPLGSYIRDIGNRIILEFEMEDGQIQYRVVEKQQVFVDISTGIPIGLMMNELITNSIKHAFPEGNPGIIEVETGMNGQKGVIRYDDNGRRLPEGFDPKEQTTLGLELIRNLTTQIQGTVRFESGSGMTCTLTFPLQKTNSHGVPEGWNV